MKSDKTGLDSKVASLYCDIKLLLPEIKKTIVLEYFIKESKI